MAVALALLHFRPFSTLTASRLSTSGISFGSPADECVCVRVRLTALCLCVWAPVGVGHMLMNTSCQRLTSATYTLNNHLTSIVASE